MAIQNGTAHEIRFYSPEDLEPHPTQRGAYVLARVADPYLVIPPGKNLNAIREPGMALEGMEVPMRTAASFVAVDPLPEGDLVVVSQLYRAALVALGRSTDQVATVSGPVYQAGNPRPIGITSLEVG